MRRTLAAIVLTAALSGCTYISDPVSQMKMPRLPEDKATLRTAINSMLPPGASLLRPANNDDSSIRTEDLNKDGVLEAIVFYETPDEAVQIHGMILEKQGKEWVKRLVFDGEGTILESVSLRDVTNDGKLDIVVGFSRSEEVLQKALVVWSYPGSALEKVLSLPYTRFTIGDLNGDGVDDITVVSFKRNEYATLSVYQFGGEEFRELDRLSTLNPYVNAYYNIAAGKVAEDKEGVVLDASIGSQSAASYVIAMENDRLVQVLPRADGDTQQTYKELHINSEDVDDDGIIEIGLLDRPSGWEYFDSKEVPWLYSYYKWDGKDGMTFVEQQYRDPDGRFTLKFPPETKDAVTVDTASVLNQYLRFIVEDTGETLAEISFFSQASWDRVKNDGWQLWATDGEKYIGYRGKLKQNIDGLKNDKGAGPIERKGIDE